MPNINLQEILKETEIATKIVGTFLKNEIQKISSSDVVTKSLNSLVTYVDKTAEEKLVKALSKILPEAGFITEEGTSTKEGEQYNWIIDPLDGTTNYIHGLPIYSVSIALSSKDEVVIGVVYVPVLDECFSAYKGGGAFLNAVSISVSKNETLADSLVATGFPYFDYARMNDYTEILKEFMQKTRGIRRMGSAAVDLAYVACGRFDSFYEYNLNAWDVAAGSLLVEEAGGIVSTFFNKSDFVFGKEIVASSGEVHLDVLEIIQKHFKPI